MTDRIFLDTNLWVYLYAENPLHKHQKVEVIIKNHSNSIQVSTQVLGELFHVITRKNFTSKSDAVNIITGIVNSFSIIEIDAPKVLQALEINTRYGYSY